MSDEMIGTIGLMSGTSLDGIDAAFIETDGERHVVAGPSLTRPYDDALRTRLRNILGGHAPQEEIAGVERDLTLAHAEIVQALIDGGLPGPVKLVGFHGHTILHRPQERRTWQIGDGELLARTLGLPVVYDFRSADVAAGGEGAPLAPVFHQALATAEEMPVAILNIGGVANVTWIDTGNDALLAFDTGPGNALIDDWALRHTGRPLDERGELAARGQVDDSIVRRFLSHPYFGVTPPKSLDRDEFSHLLPHGLGPEDGAATLTAITAAAVARALDHIPAAPRRWLVTGGGRHNPVLMAALAERLGVPVVPIETIGSNGDALEAQAFAYLAVRSRRGLPLSFPGTTGVPQPMSGGRYATG